MKKFWLQTKKQKIKKWENHNDKKKKNKLFNKGHNQNQKKASPFESESIGYYKQPKNDFEIQSKRFQKKSWKMWKSPTKENLKTSRMNTKRIIFKLNQLEMIVESSHSF